MKLVKRCKGSKVYEDDFIRLILIERGAIRGEHVHPKEETLYLISGKSNLIIEDKKIRLNSPSKILIPKNTSHIIKSITDSIIIEKLE
jgi:quercetin dioxygenase-like cupin family protein